MKEVLKYCENKPEVVVDRGFFGIHALQRLGLKYRYETFGERNAVEGFFFKLKERTKRFWNRFPFRSSFDSIQLVREFYGVLQLLEVFILTASIWLDVLFPLPVYCPVNSSCK